MGTTGPGGLATLSTNGRFPGAAAGQYKVVIYKEEVKVVGEDVFETLLVGRAYTSSVTTPLEYTMEAKAAEVTFEAKSR